jgi:hypothetical protein
MNLDTTYIVDFSTDERRMLHEVAQRLQRNESDVMRRLVRVAHEQLVTPEELAEMHDERERAREANMNDGEEDY